MNQFIPLFVVNSQMFVIISNLWNITILGTTMSINDYIKSVDNQELKGILLKLRNELKKQDPLWEEIQPVLSSLYDKDVDVFNDVLPLIIQG